MEREGSLPCLQEHILSEINPANVFHINVIFPLSPPLAKSSLHSINIL
jgi:hypothetical protein